MFDLGGLSHTTQGLRVATVFGYTPGVLQDCRGSLWLSDGYVLPEPVEYRQ